MAGKVSIIDFIGFLIMFSLDPKICLFVLFSMSLPCNMVCFPSNGLDTIRLERE